MEYGPTPDNPVNHWYEFGFDGQTGAEINGNLVTLHFVDGQRGDSDLAVNGVIVDPGAPAQNANISGSSGGGGGCSVIEQAGNPGAGRCMVAALPADCITANGVGSRNALALITRMRIT